VITTLCCKICTHFLMDDSDQSKIINRERGHERSLLMILIIFNVVIRGIYASSGAFVDRKVTKTAC
jgi:hypothetical protein